MMELENKLYMYVYRVILADIFNGVYTYNSKLPAIPDICLKYKVGRNTVRSALLTLQEDGYIVMKRGVQAKVILDHNNEQLRYQYMQVLSNSRMLIKNVFETMRLIFPYMSYICLRKATPEQVKQLYDRLDHLSTETIHSEENIVKELFGIYEEAFSFFDNPIFDNLVTNILYSMYYPTFPKYKNNVDFEKSLNHIRKVFKLALKTFEKGNQFIVKNTVSGLIVSFEKLLDNYIIKTCGDIVPTNEKKFVWNLHGDEDFLYMQVVFEIITDISNQVYKKGDLLPSIAQLSEIYNVSDRTSRRALKALNGYSIVKTMNGVGSKVIASDLSKNKKILKKPEIKRNIIKYYYSSQLLTMINQAVLFDILKEIPKAKLQEVADELETARHFSLTLFFDYVYSQTNQCLQAIYKELAKDKVWGVLANLFTDRTYYRTDDLKKSFYTALRNKNIPLICQITEEMSDISIKSIDIIL